MIQRAARRVGIDKPVSPHWLRHSFVTFGLAAGAPILDVKDKAGHADIRTTMIYYYEVEDERSNEFDQFFINWF